MSYRLRYNRRFMQQLEVLAGDLRSIARRQISALSENPRPSRTKALDSHPGYYRLWLPRGHRLVYQVLEDEKIVDLLYVGPKSPGLYEDLGLGR
jgi:mRNA-degrading endonuclease RelE of RelBE toxin-antitoxin system